MGVGMATLGNLGMALGWWADAGFGPAATCCCADWLAQPGMWVGMFAASNVAMLTLLRTPHASANCRTALFVGGNLGMAAGMLAGGRVAAALGGAVVVHYLGMAAGMVAGMAVGHGLARRLLEPPVSPAEAPP